MVEKIGKTIRTITLLTNYFTVLTLVSFGVSCMGNEALTTYAIVVFISAFMYFVLTTAIFVIGPKKKKESKDKKDKRSFLKFLYKISKLWIIILPLFSFTNTFSVNFTHPALTKVLSIIWLIFQIGIEIVIMCFKLTIKKISNRFQNLKEEKRQKKSIE